MDAQTALSLAYPIGLGLAALGSSIGLGRAVSSAMEAMGRQPEAAGKIQVGMIIGAAFIEAITIYVLISIFLARGVALAGSTAPEETVVESTIETSQILFYDRTESESNNISYYIPS